MFLSTRQVAWRKDNSKDHQFVFHGESITRLGKLNPLCMPSIPTNLMDSKKMSPQGILLAAPYVFVFTHETIHLTHKELRRLDQQTIPLSQLKTNPGIIESFKTGKNKAITIHARLTDEGNQLMTTLFPRQFHTRWASAIIEIIRKSLMSPEMLEENHQVRIYLEKEAIQIEKKVTSTCIEHINYPSNRDRSTPTHRLIDHLLGERQATSKHQVIDLRHTTQPDKNALSYLATILSRKKPRIKSRKIRHKGGGRLRKWYTRFGLNKPLAIITVMLTITGIMMSYQASQTRLIHQQWVQSIGQLRLSLAKFETISAVESRYFRLTALQESTKSLKRDPTEIIGVIASILPEAFWIKTFKISKDSIDLTLIGQNKPDMTGILAQLSQQFGKTNLQRIEKVQLRNTSYNQIAIQIRKEAKGWNFEKLD